MIEIKILDSIGQINEACIVLYKSHIKYMKWKFLPNNPSEIRVEEKKSKKCLLDKYTYRDDTIWFGAFDKDKIVGCTRLCKAVNGSLEMEGYTSSYPIKKYLPKNKELCVESTRTAVLPNYADKGIAKLLLLAAFKYCEAHHYSMAATVSHNYLKSYLRKIGLPLKIEHAFKYEPQDPFPVNFYFADYKKGELRSMIDKMENFQNKKENNILDILNVVAPIIPVPVYWHDKNGVVLGLNEHCLKGIGASKHEDIIGKTPYDFYPQEIAEEILMHNVQVMQTGEILSRDELIKDIKTGEIKYFRNTKAPLYDEKGHIIGIIGSAVDITAEKENKILKAKVEAQNIFKECVDKIHNDLETSRLKVINSSIGNNKNIIHENIELTKRQGEILYLASLGKNIKQIASILSFKENKNLTAATINVIINKHLYPKFNVNNLSDLIEKAKILNLIPFLHNSFIDIVE